MVSDQDSKFVSNFSGTMFHKLGTRMPTMIARYLQTNRQSERANQTVEIALRYFFTVNLNNSLTYLLPYL